MTTGDDTARGGEVFQVCRDGQSAGQRAAGAGRHVTMGSVLPGEFVACGPVRLRTGGVEDPLDWPDVEVAAATTDLLVMRALLRIDSRQWPKWGNIRAGKARFEIGAAESSYFSCLSFRYYT